MHFFTKKCKINKKTQKNLRIAGFFCSATRTREFRGIRKFHRNNRQSVAAENPRLRVRICSKKEPARFLFSSATRTREFRGIRKFHRNNRQSVAAENPRLRVRICSKKEPARFLFCSATRTRTGVYGVRGRCPRPLDDSTLLLFERKQVQKYCFFLT